MKREKSDPPDLVANQLLGHAVWTVLRACRAAKVLLGWLARLRTLVLEVHRANLARRASQESRARRERLGSLDPGALAVWLDAKAMLELEVSRVGVVFQALQESRALLVQLEPAGIPVRGAKLAHRARPVLAASKALQATTTARQAPKSTSKKCALDPERPKSVPSLRSL